MDWLPSPPAGANQVVELAADRLALFGHPRPLRGELVVFDRQSETWESTTMRLPDGLEAHVPSRVLLAPDSRIYLGSTFEGESGPMHWWSYAVGGAGEARPETTLTGSAVAWADGHQATADNHGRVVVSSSARERIVADERPLGCEVPTDPELAEIPVTIGLAGNRPVVTYWCGDDPTLVTLVYDVDGAAAVQVAGASLLTADEDHVLLVSGEGGPAGLYLLDLDRLAITRIGPGIHEVQVGLADGLVLWNQPGPIDDRDVYDVVWKVARLPDGE
jgi:hypothetical protein